MKDLPLEQIIRLWRDGWKGNPLLDKYPDIKNLDYIISNPTFHDYYEIIGSTVFHPVVKETPRMCRFCNKTEPETTFNKEAHLISAFLGADYISYDECDNCNIIFSKYESHFSKYYGVYLTLLGIKGRNGIPTFSSRSNDETQLNRTTIVYKENGDRAINMIHINDFPFDKKQKNGELAIRTAPLKLLSIYKLIVKYGLSILPYNKVEEHRASYEWLQGNRSTLALIPTLFESILPDNKMFSSTEIYLFERKKEHQDNLTYTPKYSVVLRFGNLRCQIFLPIVNEEYNHVVGMNNNGIKPNLNSHLVFAINAKQIDLSDNKNKGRDYFIPLSFEK